MPQKKYVDFASFGPVIFASLVSRIDTLDETSMADLDVELTWLMSAADSLYKIATKALDGNHKVPTSIPESAVQKPEANNRLLPSVDAFYLETIWPIKLEGAYNQLDRHQKNLNLLLEREAKLGNAAISNIALQNQISDIYTSIVVVLEEMATLTEEAYGVFTPSLKQLSDLLD